MATGTGGKAGPPDCACGAEHAVANKEMGNMAARNVFFMPPIILTDLD